MTFQNTREFAQELDSQDKLHHYRNEFLFPQVNGRKVIYFTGNSLGLQPKRTKAYVDEVMDDWAKLAVEDISMQKSRGGITMKDLRHP